MFNPIQIQAVAILTAVQFWWWELWLWLPPVIKRCPHFNYLSTVRYSLLCSSVIAATVGSWFEAAERLKDVNINNYPDHETVLYCLSWMNCVSGKIVGVEIKTGSIEPCEEPLWNIQVCMKLVHKGHCEMWIPQVIN